MASRTTLHQPLAKMLILKANTKIWTERKREAGTNAARPSGLPTRGARLPASRPRDGDAHACMNGRATQPSDHAPLERVA
jgi:hypothetical protein